MRCSPFPVALALALAWFSNSPQPAQAYVDVDGRTPVATPLQQASRSESIVIGQVTALEPALLPMVQQPGNKKVYFMVAVVKVEETLLGSHNLTHLRVGFIPGVSIDVDPNDIAVQLGCLQGRNESYNPNLREGQVGCFFLKKHPKADFYTVASFGEHLDQSSSTYEDDLEQVKKSLKVLRNPIAALQAKDALDRQFAACVLLQHYRLPSQASIQGMKAEPIPQEESKLILTALSEMLWGDPGLDRQNTLTIQTIFGYLGATDQDGWRPPPNKDGEDYNFILGDAVKKWLQENASKYRIQRYVGKKK